MPDSVWDTGKRKPGLSIKSLGEQKRGRPVYYTDAEVEAAIELEPGDPVSNPFPTSMRLGKYQKEQDDGVE